MLLNRREFLSALEATLPGVSSKESVEQSSCFIFSPNKITTFNDEILCRQDTPLEITGAVPHKPLLEIMRKLSEDEIAITATEKELRIKGAGRRMVVRLSTEILLPSGIVEEAHQWRDMCPAFADALTLVAGCAAKDNDRFELNCVHLTPTTMQACDESQLVQYRVDTGLSAPTLIRKQSCMAVQGLGVAASAESDNWLHWKTYTGLVLSVRKYDKEYPDLSGVVDMPSKGSLMLPAGVMEALDRASPFMASTSTGKAGIVRLEPGKMIIRALNHDGWYEESRELDYDGVPVSFGINPKYASNLIKHGLPCELTDNALRIRGESFIYALALEAV